MKIHLLLLAFVFLMICPAKGDQNVDSLIGTWKLTHAYDDRKAGQQIGVHYITLTEDGRFIYTAPTDLPYRADPVSGQPGQFLVYLISPATKEPVPTFKATLDHDSLLADQTEDVTWQYIRCAPADRHDGYFSEQKDAPVTFENKKP